MNTSTRTHTPGEHATLFLAIGLAASRSSVVRRKTVSGTLILCSLQCRMTHNTLPQCMLLSICHYHHQPLPLVALSTLLCSQGVRPACFATSLPTVLAVHLDRAKCYEMKIIMRKVQRGPLCTVMCRLDIVHRTLAGCRNCALRKKKARLAKEMVH